MGIYLYVLNTLSDWEIAYITAELNSRRFFKKDAPDISFALVGDNVDPIKTMGGMTITPQICVKDVSFNPGDILILPGADTWSEPCHAEILSLVPQLLKNGVFVAAICGATIALAQHGVLDHRKHTSNDKAFLQMSCPEYAGQALYHEDVVVTDGNLITATGLAPLEFTSAVFKAAQVMNGDTVAAWYALHNTKDPKHFHVLMQSL